MRIIAKPVLKAFYSVHNAAEQPIKVWYVITAAASWRTPIDVKATFPSADIRPGRRVVFDIGGNHFRIVTLINYRRSVLYIRFVGTHSDYSRIDVDTV